MKVKELVKQLKNTHDDAEILIDVSASKPESVSVVYHPDDNRFVYITDDVTGFVLGQKGKVNDTIDTTIKMLFNEIKSIAASGISDTELLDGFYKNHCNNGCGSQKCQPSEEFGVMAASTGKNFYQSIQKTQR